MPIDLPWSIKVFLAMQLAISTLIIVGSSYTKSITWKLSVVKVMGGMLSTRCRKIMLTNRTCRRCLFCAEAMAPPLEKPRAIVFITRLDWSKGIFSLSLKWLRLQLLCFFDRPTCYWSLPRLNSGLFLLSGLYDRDLWMKFFRWPSLISSSILSFKALRSSVEWLRLRWYR